MQDANLSTPLRCAVFCTMPRNSYSGGRYHALMLAEALANGGHEVCLVTNCVPSFYRDVSCYPRHHALNVVITRDFHAGLPEGKFDIVVVVPGSTMTNDFFYGCRIFARERGAQIVFLNFESGNWFNHLAPKPRPLKQWDKWKQMCRHANVILSSAEESTRWARDFYTDCPPDTVFASCHPAINTLAADSVPEVPRENRLVIFVRFIMGEHKGCEQLAQIFCESMRGHTLVLLMGAGDMDTGAFNTLQAKAQEYGISLDIKHRLTDREKFLEIKRAKAMLFPSYFEGYGYPPIEAQYCNTPCIAFDLPVLRETSGDNLHYARHGDWDDFRRQLTRFLDGDVHTPPTQEQIRPIATLDAMTENLNAILLPLVKNQTTGANARAPKARALRARSYAYRLIHRRALRQRMENKARDILRRVRTLIVGLRTHHRHGAVCYYPPFESQADLTNHYWRACWYLPKVEKWCDHVLMFQQYGRPDAVAAQRPEYMAPAPSPTDHIQIRKGGTFATLRAMLKCSLVLDWKGGKQSWLLRLLALAGIKVVNVATEDLQGKEYGSYCSLIWKCLLPNNQRQLILGDSRRRFETIARRIRTENPENVCVFGTGPSLERAFEYDCRGSLNIVCNSIVQNDGLLDHTNPTFACAGDVVSHLGISAYAHQFRADLIRVLQQREMYFVSTAAHGSILLWHYPELAKKLILIDQTTAEPNFDLLTQFAAPQLDSVLNVLMLPMAATFAKKIWLLGIDGKSPEPKKNEDFWTHAQGAQYFDLVDTGHQCHPTFDAHRQASTYVRYLRSTEETLRLGELNHGIEYRSLCPSHIPPVNERAVPPHAIVAAALSPPYALADLAALSPSRTWLTYLPAPKPKTNGNLPPRLGISTCRLTPERILHVRGWALAEQPVDQVLILLGDTPLGTANLKLRRDDVAAANPKYEEDKPGFEFYMRLDRSPADLDTVQVQAYSRDVLVIAQEQKVKVFAD